MAQKDNDIFLIVGGIIAIVAGIFGVNYLTNNNNKTNVQQDVNTKSSCNKCPFSK